jgi:hypothetical protein
MLEDLASELRRLEDRPNRADPKYIERARALDSKLHDTIAASCNNEFLRQELRRLKILFRAFRDVSWAYARSRNDFRRLAGEAGEHLAIVEALLAGDAKAAARAMSQHIRAGVKYWTRALPAVRGADVLPATRGVGVSPATRGVGVLPAVRTTKDLTAGGTLATHGTAGQASSGTQKRGVGVSPAGRGVGVSPAGRGVGVPPAVRITKDLTAGGNLATHGTAGQASSGTQKRGVGVSPAIPTNKHRSNGHTPVKTPTTRSRISHA